MREYIRELIKRIGVSAVFVTHDYSEALVLADRVLVMDGGVIAENGTPEQIYSQPRTRIAAETVGTSNLIDVSAIDASGIATVSGGATLRVQHPATTTVGSSLRTIVIRPEDVRLSRPGSITPNGTDNVLDGTIVGRFYLGAITHYDIETQLGRIRCQSADRGIGIRDAVDVHIAADTVVLLDA
jgi:ABC-type Fe3+/spermidine/putrescine transport system ATPase subunit